MHAARTIADMLRLLLALTFTLATLPAAAQSVADAPFPHALTAKDVADVLPTNVFFQGRSAPLQARNAGGILVGKAQYILAALVDTSGYSTSIQDRYQAYLLTEQPITLGGHKLPAGAYGFGFLPAGVLVMDLGGHELFTAPSAKDPSLKRPSPLQVLSSDKPRTFRLFAGRTYVEVVVEPLPAPAP